MKSPLHFEVKEGYLYVQFSGFQEFGLYREAVAAIVAESRRVGLNRILVDLSATNGHLSTQNKYDLGVFVAGQVNSRLKVAVLISQSDVDDRFFEQVASNRGAYLKDFSDLESARAWLLGASE